MKKRIPKFKSDAEAAKFLEQDLSDYLDPDNLVPVTFEFAPKNKVVNLRMSDKLLDSVKAMAKKRHMPYQRYIREIIEQSVRGKRA